MSSRLAHGLSAVGTAGSLTGVFVTGFVFVARFPITPVVVGVGAALVALGLALRWGQRSAVPTERMMGSVSPWPSPAAR